MDDNDKKEGKPTVHSNQDKPQTVKRINPLGMRVVVKIREIQEMTDGGLYLPETAKKQMSESLLAEVLEVASAVDNDTDEETNISGIPLGALVLIQKNVGTVVPWDETLRVVDTKDILGLVDEVEVV